MCGGNTCVCRMCHSPMVCDANRKMQWNQILWQRWYRVYRTWSSTNWKRWRDARRKIRNRFFCWGMHRSANGRWCTLLLSRRCCDVNVIWFIFFFSITDFCMEFCNPRLLAHQCSIAHQRMMNLEHASIDMRTARCCRNILFFFCSCNSLKFAYTHFVTCKLRTDESNKHRSVHKELGRDRVFHRDEKERMGKK